LEWEVVGDERKSHELRMFIFRFGSLFDSSMLGTYSTCHILGKSFALNMGVVQKIVPIVKEPGLKFKLTN
jgi:hypothetical protein